MAFTVHRLSAPGCAVGAVAIAPSFDFVATAAPGDPGGRVAGPFGSAGTAPGEVEELDAGGTVDPGVGGGTVLTIISYRRISIVPDGHLLPSWEV
jgi:hypothetical protein